MLAHLALLPAPRSRPRWIAILAVVQMLAATTALATGIRIAAFGDYGEDSVRELAVSVLVDSLAVDAIITLGDNSYGDTLIDVNIGKYYSDYIGDYTGAFGPGSPVNRFFPSLGNHDYNDGGGLPAYLDYFTLPGTGIQSTNTSGQERYYDFVLGPIHFFAINSEGQEPDGRDSSSVQAQWLQAQLAASASPWKLVYCHRPPFSSGGSGSTPVMQWPYAEWGATAVLAGHAHVYERIVLDDFPYFVGGTGGRSLDTFGPPIAGSIVRYNEDNGTLLILADAASITFEFHSVAGGDSLIDSYTVISPNPFPDIAVDPASHDFGGVLIGSSSSRTFLVRNEGAADLNVTATTLSGADAAEFAIESGAAPFALAPGDSSEVEVSFTPLTAGGKSVLLGLASDDPDESPLDVPLSGSGLLTLDPDIAASTVSLDFGSVAIGADSSLAFAIRNDGASPLNVTATELEGPHAAEFTLESGGAPFALAPGDTLEIVVRFHPFTLGSKSATLGITSDDPDESPLDIALGGIGLPPPATATVVFEEIANGGSTSSIVVATSGSVTGNGDDLYLAAVASKSYTTVASVTGLGASWSRQRAQCGGRHQTGVELWMAQGVTSGGPVTATFSEVPQSAVITVSRYSGADLFDPLGTIVSENTNGSQGACDGGKDGSTYSLNLETNMDGAVVFGTVAMRQRVHTPGFGWVLRDDVRAGTGGSVASVAVVDQSFETAGPLVLDGTFDSTVDWAVIGAAIRPGSTLGTAAAVVSRSSGLDLTPRPNPFRLSTDIEYTLPAPAEVELVIYDVVGREVKRLASGRRGAGPNEVSWNGRNDRGAPVGSGVYFVRLRAGEDFLFRKLVRSR